MAFAIGQKQLSDDPKAVWKRQWRLANPVLVREAIARSGQRRKLRGDISTPEQRQRRREVNRDWLAKNKSWNKFNLRRAAWNRYYGLSEDDVCGMLVAQRNACNGCGDGLDVSNLSIDHIVAVSKGGPNLISNFQLLCDSCQHAKWDDSMTDFVERARKIVRTHDAKLSLLSDLI